MKKIFFLFYLIIYAQTSVCQGVNGYIKDKTQQPLISATLQFINLQTKGEKFLFSDNKGNFEIKLDVGKYKLITRYLGYKNDVREIEISSNVVIELNITLYEDENIIHEVEIIAAPPAMIQKKDTTIYFADSFAIGDERKLRELLEKFPGLTVEGNKVMFKGKPITKLMVENKDFFTGSVAFGINNLPADAVSSVEVLQNYSEVAFLKDKFYGDDIALNVKLKKDKSNIVFGDIESAISNTKNYDGKLSTYYYNPKYTANVILDANTLGREVLSLEDKEFLFNKKQSYVRGVSSNSATINEVIGFNINFFKSDQKLATIFQNFTLSKSSDLRLIGLFDYRSTQGRSEIFNRFLQVSASTSDENRIIENIYDHRLLYGRMDYTLNHSNDAYFKLTGDYLQKNNMFDNLIMSTLPLFDQSKEANQNTTKVNIHSEFYKKFKKGTILSLSGDFVSLKNDQELLLRANSLAFLEDYFQASVIDSLFGQDFNVSNSSVQTDASYTIPINAYSDIAFGYSLHTKSIQSEQSFFASIVENLSPYHFDLTNQVGNLSFLRNVGDNKFEVSLGLQHAHFMNAFTTMNKMLIVPQVNYKTKINKLGDITFNYKRIIGNPHDERLIPFAQVQGIDDIRVGNNSNFLTDQHGLGLVFYRMNPLRQTSWIANVQYTIPYTVQTENARFAGLYTLRNDTLITGGNRNLIGMLRFAKVYRGINIMPSINYIESVNQTLVNDVITNTFTRNITGRINIIKIRKGMFRPSFMIQYTKTLSKINAAEIIRNRLAMSMSLALQLKTINFSLFYRPSWVFSSDRENVFINNIGFEIRHFKKNSPWEVGLSGVNLAQNNSNFSVSTSARSISERFDYLFPRQIVLKISYKI